ncbi:hypothetical protein SAMN05216249_11827 [Acetitomaculum ruminis DSM 5522]|uniref:Uncharacterized protein n=1 Tax=Acetitomaculum ruminis DSM 5522 TaxID=1120918 RepID=A0A1I1A005_9FIRM|nr:hypothetical protein [Acetitomaculum ruminis]SFB29898.1 hypothetical protein SAMN05216249_11827 [Acetitomaculum ruminis DSM 5522]
MILDRFEMSEAEKAGLEEYIRNVYATATEVKDYDDSYISAWDEVVSFADMLSGGDIVNEYILKDKKIDFVEPEKIRVEVYDSFAGKIPVIYFENPKDFEDFVAETVYEGKTPQNLKEIGASIYSKDNTRFVVLSSKGYCNISAKEMGLPEEVWHLTSMIIRREHECTHCYTNRHFGISNFNLHDELMADFFGMYEAVGYYKAEDFLKFIGVLESSGKRIDEFTEEMTPSQKEAICEIAAICAQNLEKWSNTDEFRAMTRQDRVKYLCMAGIEGMFLGI